ncbi:hypothetical protein SAMN04489761_0362 [Tenacibaculum sp. MAR_2009_124]|uniref:alpha/beta hydrolase n=1 Tax=Tenacibaculum sp. MAR_2009_124 TaxID=1250059 RepID=UPI00089876EA|nr:alpha/beta hydrolase [Tenacibaculum sp. MAR_2009_124]SEB38807.1 hypothetical protein SAMN04489761_0362 [Tenacibaculum sp. MAR_2009_124]
MKLKLNFKHGDIEGIIKVSHVNDTIVIITNGHNGFYNYGMFPFIQEELLKNNISSFSYNFSHGGVIGDADRFDDLEKYEKNCMRLEKLDFIEVHKAISSKYPKAKIVHLAHSLGGIPTTFGVLELEKQNIPVAGAILLATVKKLDIWTKEVIEQWKTNKVLFKKNNRTKQELPQGSEFLIEVLNARINWNVETALGDIKTPFYYIHGKEDEAIPYEHGVNQFLWKTSNSELSLIEKGTHTLNTKHPFQGPSPQLSEFLDLAINWIKEKSK